jgi:hypothetical protein
LSLFRYIRFFEIVIAIAAVAAKANRSLAKISTRSYREPTSARMNHKKGGEG